jgi:hypothetical protein
MKGMMDFSRAGWWQILAVDRGEALFGQKKALMRIGIDVLVPRYVDEFPTEYTKHEMLYVTSTEKAVPIPDAFCDVIYSVISLDHVKTLFPCAVNCAGSLNPEGN